MSVRRIKISGHLLDSFLRDSELWESSLPWDVHVVGIAGEDDEPPQSFVLLAESNYFPSIADGHLIPPWMKIAALHLKLCSARLRTASAVG